MDTWPDVDKEESCFGASKASSSIQWLKLQKNKFIKPQTVQEMKAEMSISVKSMESKIHGWW